ncbi:MAG TPA: hypothetical protein DIU15_06705 [Deltaproteobacteria bacterium]|nr:hypothetical protein [Deltaproteobacteria bacterium]HCP45712.1 hypothetical protein [Deltaproteobacteria bacterium]
MHINRAGLFVRIGLLLLAFVLGFAAFRMGAGVSDRAGVGSGDLMADVYYTLGLFVLGGLDLGVPNSGPIVAQKMLWVAYFFAPLIVTSAVVETALKLVRPQTLQLMGLRDHVVIVGMGRTGMLYLEALRLAEPKRKVVVVGREVGEANLVEARERFGAVVLQGDISRRETREALKLHRSVGVALLTDDDLVNLEAAWDIAEEEGDGTVPLLAHVAEVGTRRRAAQLLEQSEHSSIELFNSHEAAAVGLYQEHLEQLRQTPGESVVVLAGFGRFGQTILAHLEDEFSSPREIRRVVIVDRNASLLFKVFRKQVGRDETHYLPTQVIDGDLADPELWEAIERDLTLEDDPVYVLGTDDDWLNIRTGIMLRAAGKVSRQATILVRCFHDSDFIGDMSGRLGLGLVLLPVEKKMRSVLAERHGAWVARSRGLFHRKPR